MKRRRGGIVRAFSIACLAAWVAVAHSGRAYQPPAVWIILIDDLHLDFTATGHIQNLLRTITGRLPQEEDLVAAVSTGPSSVAFDLTKEHAEIESVIKRVSGAGVTRAEILQSGSTENSEFQYRAHLAFAKAYAAVTKLGQVTGRRKALIYISNGYTVDLWPGGVRNDVNPFRANATPLTDERLRAEVAELTHEARRGSVTIVAVNVAALLERGLRAPRADLPAWDNYRAASQRSLEVISEETGGFAIEDDLEDGLERLSSIIRR